MALLLSLFVAGSRAVRAGGPSPLGGEGGWSAARLRALGAAAGPPVAALTGPTVETGAPGRKRSLTGGEGASIWGAVPSSTQPARAASARGTSRRRLAAGGLSFRGRRGPGGDGRHEHSLGEEGAGPRVAWRRAKPAPAQTRRDGARAQWPS